LFVKEGAAAAYYDRFGGAMADGLSGRDAIALEEIMHVADTVVDLRASTRPRATDSHGQGGTAIAV
jgi:hypothetical protein